ncbi:head GIN domain-containing protein [Tsuneonella sp. HG249]
MLHRILKGLAPVAALAIALSTSACDADVSINGEKGVPLAELETEGKSPTGIVLAGPDSVVVTNGSELKIEVSGDPEAVAALRFTLNDDTLGVSRKKDAAKPKGKARVAVTLPTLEKIVLAGSGNLEASGLSGKAEVTIAGTGTATTTDVDASELEVTIAGSGTYRASGKVPSLELTVAGSGSADMVGLNTENADVTIAGSGDASFASDGTVKATVMGSGNVTVTGEAKCTIKSMGSGRLNCSAGTSTAQSAAGEAPPTPPMPPAAPRAPETPE